MYDQESKKDRQNKDSRGSHFRLDYMTDEEEKE
jgi:aspartate oxidase